MTAPTAEERLEHPPSMTGLFARAGTALLPLLGRRRRATEVPDRALALQEVRTDRDRLAAYARVCGFDLSDTLPVTYPHMLAFPLHLALMTAPDFPLPAIGLVHIANEITVQRPIDARETLSIRVWAGPLEPHPRGRRFEIHTEVRSEGEVVWSEVSTNLKRESGSAQQPAAEPPADREPLEPTATWRLPGDLGRRYGAVSGDLNPIHVHALSARLFGFPGAIAHGMWTKARCLAALGPELPRAGFTARATFRRPIVLPATVHFAEASRPGGLSFEVRDVRKATPHLEGAVLR